MAATTWTAPALDDVFICYDEDGTPSRMCRYVGFLSEIETDIWPKDADDYELLLWSYNAEPAA